MKTKSRRELALALLAMLLLLGVALWAWWPTAAKVVDNDNLIPIPSTDPRTNYAGPYHNVAANVKYVGSEQCADCHFDIASSFAKNPMGHSLTPIQTLASTQPYGDKHNNPFRRGNSVYQVLHKGDRVWHRHSRVDREGKTIFDHDVEVRSAIGSGSHGYSYLSCTDGYLFQTSISWFSQKQIWDLSPGWSDMPRRPIQAQCLFCHANRALPVSGTVNRYQEPIFQGHGIGCERCHGPGELHVQKPGKFEETRIDPTIVNPAKLPWSQREAVCQQCHLTGVVRVLPRGRDLYDFRPGLPLDSSWSIFVDADQSGQDKKAVNHVEQMYLSRCFASSNPEKKLGCISCHDPHQKIGPERRLAFYRERCLRCHSGSDQPEQGKSSCTLDRKQRQLKQDNCMGCHMPRYDSSDIAHAAMTDHRIVRRPERISPDAIAAPIQRLAHFHRGTIKMNDKAGLRDLGIALVQLAQLGKASPEPVLAQALPLLEEASLNDIDDVEVWEMRATALMMTQQYSEALACLETSLARHAQQESLLWSGALSLQLLRQPEKSMAMWRRAVQRNPEFANYRANLTQVLLEQRHSKDALQQAQAAVRLDPANVSGRLLLVQCLLRTGDRGAALEQFRLIERLEPDNLRDLRAWWTAENKGKPTK